MRGVTTDVAAAMETCGATTIAEDNLLFRQCGCGTQHPVGHLGRTLNDVDWKTRHHKVGQPVAFIKFALCCGCCDTWTYHAPRPIDAASFDARQIERAQFEAIQ